MAEPCALLPVENWNVKASTAIKNYEKKVRKFIIDKMGSFIEI